MNTPPPRTPEQLAREKIDALLAQAGWLVQDRVRMNLGAGSAVAVREFPTDAGPPPVAYSPFIPPEFFDVVVVDELIPLDLTSVKKYMRLDIEVRRDD